MEEQGEGAVVAKLLRHAACPAAQALGALSNLAISDANEVGLVAAGAHLALLAVLELHADNDEVVDHALRALRNLSSTRATGVAAVVAGALRVLDSLHARHGEEGENANAGLFHSVRARLASLEASESG